MQHSSEPVKKIQALKSSEDYINSLRGRKLKVYLFGEPVADIVEHPMIRPSINAVAETYDLAEREPELASATSHLTGQKVNRFLNIAMTRDEVVLQNKMQRRLGPINRNLFSTLCRDGRAQFAVFRDL